MRKRRRADLAAVRLVGAVADQIDAEFALRTFGRHINFARGDVETLGVELEVMDQRFHRLLHLATLRRHDLAVEAGDRKSCVEGTSVSGRVVFGSRRTIKKKKKSHEKR